MVVGGGVSRPCLGVYIIIQTCAMCLLTELLCPLVKGGGGGGGTYITAVNELGSNNAKLSNKSNVKIGFKKLANESKGSFRRKPSIVEAASE